MGPCVDRTDEDSSTGKGRTIRQKKLETLTAHCLPTSQDFLPLDSYMKEKINFFHMYAVIVLGVF